MMLVSYGGVSIVAAVSLEEGYPDVAGWIGLLSPMTLFDGVQVWLLEAESSWIAPPPGTIGGIVYCLVAVGFVAATFGLLLVRYRRLAAA